MPQKLRISVKRRRTAKAIARIEMAFWARRNGGELDHDFFCYGCDTNLGEYRDVLCLGPTILRNREERIREILSGYVPDEIVFRRKPFWIFDLDMIKDYWRIEKIKMFLRYETRKARVTRAEGFHEKSHYRVLWEIQGGRCYYSGTPLGESFEKRKFHVDHIIPLAARDRYFDVGPPGTNWPTNLALVSKSVNLAKGGRRSNEFLADVRKRKAFTLTTTSERRRMDRLRIERFSQFMAKHCPDWNHP